MVDLCYSDRQLITICHIKQLRQNVYKNMWYWFAHNQNSLIWTSNFFHLSLRLKLFFTFATTLEIYED